MFVVKIKGVCGQLFTVKDIFISPIGVFVTTAEMYSVQFSHYHPPGNLSDCLESQTYLYFIEKLEKHYYLHRYKTIT